MEIIKYQIYSKNEYEPKNFSDLRSNSSYDKLSNSKKLEYFIDRVGHFSFFIRKEGFLSVLGIYQFLKSRQKKFRPLHSLRSRVKNFSIFPSSCPSDNFGDFKNSQKTLRFFLLDARRLGRV